ncbi:MAG: hypothetical protein OEX08_01730 [Candidatus Nomurabacteria bacterium]|nr:hypothetical protein [Candidatus Nomurabacteria bacterium]
METFIQADIFFFITSIATVLLTLILVWVLIRIMLILRDIKRIAKTLRRGAEGFESVAKKASIVSAVSTIFGALAKKMHGDDNTSDE